MCCINQEEVQITEIIEIFEKFSEINILACKKSLNVKIAFDYKVAFATV